MLPRWFVNWLVAGPGPCLREQCLPRRRGARRARSDLQSVSYTHLDVYKRQVVTTAGTTSERVLRKRNKEKKMNMSIISAKDHGEACLTLQTGRAVAFMMDDALLYGEMAKAKRVGDWAVVGTPQSLEAYGCMMRKGDPAFRCV